MANTPAAARAKVAPNLLPPERVSLLSTGATAVAPVFLTLCLLSMTTSRLSLLFVLATLATTLTGCELAGDLVKGGIWIGVIGVFAVVALIFWLVTKMGGGKNPGA